MSNQKCVARWVFGCVLAITAVFTSTGTAKQKALSSKSLADYLRRLTPEQTQPVAPVSAGSLWTDHGRFSDLASDYKARRVGDLVTILVAQSLQSQNTGNVATDRNFKASSGIDALAGHIKTSGVQNIFSPTSSQSLSGKAQASSSSSLRTSLTGRVVAVLPSGLLVIEAEREIMMNNEHQTVLLRGLVRTGDLAPDNSVTSTSVGNLELELKGKGVVSDGVRPPSTVMRWLLRVVGF
jgi:flagellar L-ring protein precursor FlgH